MQQFKKKTPTSYVTKVVNESTVSHNALPYFRLIAIDSANITSAIVRVTIIECPACVNGQCNPATAQTLSGSDNTFYKNASCICNRGWTGMKSDWTCMFC